MGTLARVSSSQPPQISCTTIATCEPLCEEKIAAACRALAQLEIAGDSEGDCSFGNHSFERACTADDGASCVVRGNVESDGAKASDWYELGCAARHAPACVLRHRVVALREDAGAQRKNAIKALAAACKGKQAGACTWYADALAHDKPSEAEKLWRAACDGGEGRACRKLGQFVRGPLSPGWTSSARSPPIDEPALARALALFDRGCKLGDTSACILALDERSQNASVVKARCGEDVSWDR